MDYAITIIYLVILKLFTISMSDYYNLRSSTHTKYLAFKKSIHLSA